MPPVVLLLSATERLRKHKRLDTAQVPAWSGYLNRAFFSKDRHNAFGMTREHYRGGDAPDGELNESYPSGFAARVGKR